MRCWVQSFLILFVVILASAKTSAESTDNLLSNDFINDWSGTNDHFHGSNILAGVHNEYREQTITLSDHMDTIDIQGITSSEFSAEVWFWNQNSQSVDLIQEITDSTGKEYSNTITMSGSCGTWNGCSYQDSPTNTIIITDVANDYDITTRFSFSIPSQPNNHYGADVRNPSLILYYEPFKVDVETFSDAELWLQDFEMKYEEEFKDTEFIFRDTFKEEEIKLNDYYMFEEDMYMFMEEPKDDMKEEEINPFEAARLRSSSALLSSPRPKVTATSFLIRSPNPCSRSHLYAASFFAGSFGIVQLYFLFTSNTVPSASFRDFNPCSARTFGMTSELILSYIVFKFLACSSAVSICFSRSNNLST